MRFKHQPDDSVHIGWTPVSRYQKAEDRYCTKLKEKGIVMDDNLKRFLKNYKPKQEKKFMIPI